MASSELTLEAMVKPELITEFREVRDNWLVPETGPNKNTCRSTM